MKRIVTIGSTFIGHSKNGTVIENRETPDQKFNFKIYTVVYFVKYKKLS